jgi:hypothetical protein
VVRVLRLVVDAFGVAAAAEASLVVVVALISGVTHGIIRGRGAGGRGWGALWEMSERKTPEVAHCVGFWCQGG